MSSPFLNAPHIEGGRHSAYPAHAPNAALLIDFDNVTMGIRSDLSKELKTLLGSEVIRGKVTVQRAYADWRRYPQYIVPLSEASIDLIFAPAYGSNKKNATDIRMAIDGMELVFTRPEIGTFILLTGDSDFSSLVLKLKEYGKYVIGVGIQESSSDILVQNCDEYYSYTSLSGLRRTDEGGRESTADPWTLVERAVEQMGRRGDVMRSDRLKQVLLELDPGFDEKAVGFSKFSKFVSEASKRGLLQTRRMENGQYEIVAGKGGGARDDGEPSASRQERGDRGRRRRESDRGGRSEGRDGGRRSSDGPAAAGAASAEAQASQVVTPADAGVPSDGRPRETSPAVAPEGTTANIEAAHALLRRAVSDLLEDQESDSVRDSDVKRRMLALDGDFDEGTLGFPKFSRFLRHADEHGVIDLRQSEEGQLHVSLVDRTPAAEASAGPRGPSTEPIETLPERLPAPEPHPSSTEPGRLRPREAFGRSGKGRGEAPPLFQGQAVPRVGSATRTETPSAEGSSTGAGGVSTPGEAGPVDVERLHLPKDSENVIRYLTNSYGGVGRKTAETLVETFGSRVFEVLASDPDRVRQILPSSRADLVLEGWEADLRRRRERYLATSADVGVDVAEAPRSSGEGEDDVLLLPEAAESRRRGRRTRDATALD
jgi:uncharacterized protein (TIGR00288 family)